jgi:hypothetical protein
MAWWDSYRAVYRAELKTSALEMANHGWPVIPGTYWQADRWAGCADPGESGPVPIPDPQEAPADAEVTGIDGGSQAGDEHRADADHPPAAERRPTVAATTDPYEVARWWSQLPYSVLLSTGVACDVIEVSALVGRRVCALLREAALVVPVAATPTGRWWFAVRPGEALRPELASRPELVLRGRGSYVAAPPSQGPQGVVHWRVAPSACGWHLPNPSDLQVALLEVLGQRPVLTATTNASGAVGTGVRS